MLHELLNALEETLFMVFGGGLIAWLIGLPLGILLYSSRSQSLFPNDYIYLLLKSVVGITRSVPYVALSIALIPCTQAITGLTFGTLAAIVPLSLVGILHFAHYCHHAFEGVPTSLLESTQALGATRFQIIQKVLIPEALPHCVQAFGLTLIHLIGYSTIAGVLGGGGLGHLLSHKAYTQFELEIILSVLALLVLLIQLVKYCTRYIANSTIPNLNEF